jgi:hypothetical protein
MLIVCCGKALAPNRTKSLFDAINAELDPGICDKLPLLEGYSTEHVRALREGS